MTSSKHLKTGDYRTGVENDILTTDGVGSCIVICIWDFKKKVGAMAHMYQTSAYLVDNRKISSQSASPDLAIPLLMRELLTLGYQLRNSHVRLIGGGNMFSGVENGSASDIGHTILENTYLAIKKHGLHLSSESVGGRLGRQVKFFIHSGIIEVGSTDGSQIQL